MDNEIKEPPGSLTTTAEEEPPSRGQGVFENVPVEQWKDWKWQFANRLTSVEAISTLVGEFNISQPAATKFPVAITPYYFSLIKKFDFDDPVFAMSMPRDQELIEIMRTDPLCEDEMMPVKHLVHRYRDRALVLLTTCCSMYCRYCTRKRTVGVKDHLLSADDLANIVAYLQQHPEISDVIISGGDPFVMKTEIIENVLRAIRSVESVQIIRIGTKTPVVLPQRITPELVNMLRKYQPIWVNTHFNHPNEITPLAREACERLVDAGIPVGNQSVLLKGVNDDKHTYEALCRALVKMRVRPYYLFQCDIVNGVEHFRTRVSRGIEIMEHLRGRLSGLAIPQYVVDSPGGQGKIPILPNYVLYQTPNKVVLRNFEGKVVEYPEPG